MQYSQQPSDTNLTRSASPGLLKATGRNVNLNTGSELEVTTQALPVATIGTPPGTLAVSDTPIRSQCHTASASA